MGLVGNSAPRRKPEDKEPRNKPGIQAVLSLIHILLENTLRKSWICFPVSCRNRFVPSITTSAQGSSPKGFLALINLLLRS
jgi:hypothetical protein